MLKSTLPCSQEMIDYYQLHGYLAYRNLLSREAA